MEHRDAIQEGSYMNFLQAPESTIHPNSDMTPEQIEVSGEFVDELIELGVVAPPP